MRNVARAMLNFNGVLVVNTAAVVLATVIFVPLLILGAAQVLINELNYKDVDFDDSITDTHTI